ncbi:MARH5 ligase, partial [Polyodon spathula]|nr:MARH5 ligase [Polyodon spathula]
MQVSRAGNESAPGSRFNIANKFPFPITFTFYTVFPDHAPFCNKAGFLFAFQSGQQHCCRREYGPGIGRTVPRVPAEVGGGYASDHLSVSRTLCGALVFPSVASLVGRLLFRRVPSSLQRTVLGGIAFIAIKGALKVYYKQQQYLIQANRHILNYSEKEGGAREEELGENEDSGTE